MDVIAMISNLAGMAKEFLVIQSKKLDLKNAGDVKAAAIKQDEVTADDKAASAIAKKDSNEIRKELAE